MIIGSCNSLIRALDQRTGRAVWEYELDHPASFHGDPFIDGGLFLIGTDGQSDDGIYALDLGTGEPLWMAPMPSPGDGFLGVATDIQVLDDRVYATTLADELMCVSLADGSLLWSRPGGVRPQERFLNGTPAITPEAVYFGGLDGTACALQSADGRLLWETHLGESILTSVCLVGGAVVMGTSDGTLLVCTDWNEQSSALACVDADLSCIVWTLESPDGTSWSTPRPYIYDGHLVLGTAAGQVLEYRIADKQLVRSTRLDGVIRGLRLVGDVLYVGNMDGMVFAVER